MDPLAEIRNIGQNKANLRQLADQFKRTQGMGLFVGAGLSIPFGFKGWQQFLVDQGEVAGIPPRRVQRRLKQGEYEEAAQDLFDALGGEDAFQVGLSEEYGPHKLDGTKLQGTVSFLPTLAIGPVITTNFDRVLEKAFEDAGARFESVVWGASADDDTFKAAFQNKSYLLKLHGDVDKTTNRVLTLAEYQNSYGGVDASAIDFEKPLPRLLKYLLITRPVLFLGCSLNYDRVIKLVKHVVEGSKFAHHYAIVEQSPQKKVFLASQQYFGNHHIRPIWYPKGKHEFVELIVKFLLEQTDTAQSASQRKGVILAKGRNGGKGAKTTKISKDDKATTALEILTAKHANIASLHLVTYYEDKPRLAERAKIPLADNPELYLAQAAIHEDKKDRKLEIIRTNTGLWKGPSGTFDDLATLLEGLFAEVRQGFALAVSSRVKLKNGKSAHIPMMDFKCAPTFQNVDTARVALKKINDTSGVLLNSGRSFHYYGLNLMSEEEWHLFLGHSLLLTDLVDARYIGHALMNNECRLRLSPARLNPFIPTVVDIF